MRYRYFTAWLVIGLACIAINVATATPTPEPIATTTPTAESNLKTLQTFPDSWIGGIDISPDLKHIAVASCKKLFIYAANSYQVVAELAYSWTDCFHRVAYGSNDTLIFTTSLGKSEIWDAGLTQKKAAFELEGRVLALLFNIDKNLLLIGFDDGIRTWDTGDFTEYPPLTVIPDTYGGSYAAGISADGAIFAIEDHLPPNPPKHSVGLWSVETRHRLAQLDTETAVPRQLMFSPDGQTLAVGSETGLVQLWSVENHKIKAEFNVATDSTLTGNGVNIVQAIAFSPDKRYVAVATVNTIAVFNLTTGEQTDSLSIYASHHTALAFVPNTDTMLLGDDENLQLWHYRK